MTLYREVTGDEDEAWYADEAYRPRMIRAWLVPVKVRVCEHGVRLLKGTGHQLDGNLWCRAEVGEDSTP